MIGAQQLWWFTARAGGIVGWSLLALSVLWGLAISTKVTGRSPRPNWMLDMHRFLGGAAVVFVVVHVVSILADSYVHFGLSEVLVPFTSDWHPVAVSWGIVSAYLLLAVEITSLLRQHLSKRAWRLTHFLSFPLYGLATVHGISAGTDGTNPVLLGVMLTSAAAVVALTALRITTAVRPKPNRVPTLMHRS